LKNSSYGYRGEAHTYDNKQYLRARYYDVHSENFIQEDTYRGTQDDVASRNRYNYAQNNPYKYSDPSGHDATSMFGAGNGGQAVFKVIAGHLTLNGKVYSGIHEGRHYRDGCLFNGRYTASGPLYKDGLLANGKQNDGKIYSNGFPYTGYDNNGKYYQDGIWNPNIIWTIVDTAFTISQNIQTVAQYTVPIITPNSPTLDWTQLDAATKQKVKETAEALGTNIDVLGQFIQAELNRTGEGSLFPNSSLYDRIQKICDFYLGLNNGKGSHGGSGAGTTSSGNGLVNVNATLYEGDIITNDKIELGGMKHWDQRNFPDILYDKEGNAVSTIAKTGCMIVAFTSVLTRYGINTNPSEVAANLVAGGNSSAKWEAWSKKYGMNFVNIYGSKHEETDRWLDDDDARERILHYLRQGVPVIVGVVRKTTTGYGTHWVVAYGYEGGKIIIDDVVGNSRTTLEDRYIDTNDPTRDYSVYSLKAIYK